TRNARGLAQGLRANPGKLLARFTAQARDPRIVEARGNPFVFHVFELLNLGLLALDIAGIFYRDLHLLNDFLRKIFVSIGKVLVTDFGATKQLNQRVGARAGFLESLEFGIDGLLLGFELPIVPLGQKTDVMTKPGEAAIGVVL